MPQSDPHAILFDLDGTLLDSFASHLRAYQEAFRKIGLRLTEPDFRLHYHPDWNRFYRSVAVPADRWEIISHLWREEMAAAPTPAPYLGVANTLELLGRRARLAIVTSGSRPRVAVDLEQNRLAEHFGVVITGNEVRVPKPAPEGLLMALRALELEPSEGLFVGDTPADEEMANRAGVPFVAVVSEFTRGRFIGNHPPLASVAELPQRLGWVLGGQSTEGPVGARPVGEPDAADEHPPNR